MQIDAANTMVGRLKQKSGNDAAVCNNPALYLCICRCNAILGRWKPAVKAGNKALVFLREEEERDKAAASTDSVDKNNKAEEARQTGEQLEVSVDGDPKLQVILAMNH